MSQGDSSRQAKKIVISTKVPSDIYT